MMGKRAMLHLGFTVPTLFWATLLVSGRKYPDYNHLSHLVSELGAADAASRNIFNPGMLVCAGLSLLFVLGMVLTCRKEKMSTLPAWFLLVHGISLAGAALFPLPLAMHGRAGTLAMLLPLSPLLALILWRGPSARPFRLAAIVSLVLLCLGFSVLFPRWLPELAGLKQRFAHLGWSVWFAGLAAGLLSEKEEE